MLDHLKRLRGLISWYQPRSATLYRGIAPKCLGGVPAMGDEVSLSDYEKRILSAIGSHKDGIGIEELAGEVLLPPDVVTKAVAVLIQHQLVRVDPQTSDSELHLTQGVCQCHKKGCPSLQEPAKPCLGACWPCRH